jgi:hypothetical protein
MATWRMIDDVPATTTTPALEARKLRAHPRQIEQIHLLRHEERQRG